MTPITDKIKQLGDNAVILAAWEEDGRGYDFVRTLRFTSEELKALVSELETAKRALERIAELVEANRAKRKERYGITFDAYEHTVESIGWHIAQAALKSE